jgi:hypothetical protein
MPTMFAVTIYLICVILGLVAVGLLIVVAIAFDTWLDRWLRP